MRFPFTSWLGYGGGGEGNSTIWCPSSSSSITSHHNMCEQTCIEAYVEISITEADEQNYC